MTIGSNPKDIRASCNCSGFVTTKSRQMWGSAPVSSLRLTHLPDQSRPLLRHCIAHTLLNHVAETRFYFLHYIQLALFCLLFCILEGSFCLGSSEVNGCAFYWPSNFCSLVTASSWLQLVHLSTCKSWTYSTLTTDTNSHPVPLDCHCVSTSPRDQWLLFDLSIGGCNWVLPAYKVKHQSISDGCHLTIYWL